jgi:hypothetical protein
MVVFVDLEDEGEPPEIVSSRQWEKLDLNRNPPGADAFRAQGIAGLEEGRVNPNKNAVTEALGCYP